MWVVLVHNEVIGKSNVIYKMNSKVHQLYKEFFDKKASKYKYYIESQKHHLIANVSKSHDLVLCLAPII